MRPEVSAAPVDTALLDAHLAGWDYTDAYDVMVDGDGPESALAAIRCLSGPAPARLLLRARDLAVSTVGLKPAATGPAELFPAVCRPSGPPRRTSGSRVRARMPRTLVAALRHHAAGSRWLRVPAGGAGW